MLESENKNPIFHKLYFSERVAHMLDLLSDAFNAEVSGRGNRSWRTHQIQNPKREEEKSPAYEVRQAS